MISFCRERMTEGSARRQSAEPAPETQGRSEEAVSGTQSRTRGTGR